MSRSRILFVNSTLNRGGIERQITLLAPALMQRGYDVSIIVFYRGDYYERRLTDCGIPVHALTNAARATNGGTLRRLGIWIQRAIRIVLIARREKFDVVYGFGSSANWLATLTKLVRPTKVVWGIRNTIPLGNQFHRLIERNLSRFADVIVSNSHKGTEVYGEWGLPREKFKVIPNGIDSDLNRPCVSWRNEVREVMGVTQNELLIGAIGRMDENKDRKTFLRAAQIVLAEEPTAKFLLMGAAETHYLEQLHGLADELGIADRMLWSEPRGDIEKILNGLDVFVSSSITEGFPNIIAEAMAVGIPCVVTDAGESVEILGGMGHVTPTQDPGAMAKQILAALTSLPSVDRSVLRHRIATEYSVENMVERTEATLLGLLD